MVKRRIKRKRPSKRWKKYTPKEEGSQYESRIEEDFGSYWKKNYTTPLTLQHKFHKTKDWRFDFCFPEVLLAVEIQGFGTGHNSYKGMHGDYAKHNAAARIGWTIWYLMSKDLTPGKIRKTCERLADFIEVRKNEQLINSLKEMANAVGKGQERRLHEGDRGSNNNLASLRSKLHKRFD